MARATLLHAFPTFAAGGAQVRTVALINALGPDFHHAVVEFSGDTSAASRVAPGAGFTLLPTPPKRGSLATLSHCRELIRSVRPHLVLTYNWGAIDCAAAARLEHIPLIHTEDGFGADEASGLKLRRVLTRRIVLRGLFRFVVPSRTLESIALYRYAIPRRRVQYIANAVDTSRFRPSPKPEAKPEAKQRLGLDPALPVIGTVGHLRPEKNLALLLNAFARLPKGSANLMIVGGGPCDAELRQAAAGLGVASSVVWTGSVEDTAPYYSAMDLFVLSSSTEQMPISLLEAMASGLPSVCTNVGDCAAMLESDSEPAIVEPGNAAMLTRSLAGLLADEALRTRLGAANRELCLANYSLDVMFDAYNTLYRAAAGL